MNIQYICLYDMLLRSHFGHVSLMLIDRQVAYKKWRARGDLNPGSPAFFHLFRARRLAHPFQVRRLNPYSATGPLKIKLGNDLN